MRLRSFATPTFVLVISASAVCAAVRCVPLDHPGATCAEHYATIQAAVDAASNGDSVLVAAGTYTEQVSIFGKTVSLLGARAGEDARGRAGLETILTHPDGPLLACGNGVVVDGFTLAGAVNPDGAWVALQVAQDPCGAAEEIRIENNILRDSINGLAVGGTSGAKVVRHNWFKDNAIVPEWSAGISSYGPTWNVTVAENLFEGHAANAIAFLGTSQSGIAITGNRIDRRVVLVYTSSSSVTLNVWAGAGGPDALLELGGGDHEVTVASNAFASAGGPAILVTDASFAGPSTELVVRRNCFGNPSAVGIGVAAGAYTGNLAAPDNWWGDASGPSGSGPGTGAAIVAPGASVTFSPWSADDGVCACAVEGAATYCDDFDACTDDSCDATTGCVHAPRVCVDGDLCTTNSCNPATGCVYAPDPTVCDDEDPCTTDVCHAGSGCTHAPMSCDDASVCTTDHCDPANGQCVHAPIDCSDDNSCTTDSCDPVTGCAHAGDPEACSDGNECTADQCLPGGGCTYTPTPGAPCDDGNPCTYWDQCSLSATPACGGTAITASTWRDRCPNPPPANACSVWLGCEPGTGCAYGPADCNDGNPCSCDYCDSARRECRHDAGCGRPGEIAGVRIEEGGTIRWEPGWFPEGAPGTYEAARGNVVELPVGDGASEVCVASGVTGTSTLDADVPDAGEARWYLVRGRNTCGAGDYGSGRIYAPYTYLPRSTDVCP